MDEKMNSEIDEEINEIEKIPDTLSVEQVDGDPLDTSNSSDEEVADNFSASENPIEENDMEEVREEEKAEEVAEEKVAEEELPCNFAVFYNPKNLREMIAAIILRETYSCKIFSLMPDFVAGINSPEIEEFIFLGPHWNKRLDITLKLFPNVKITIFSMSPNETQNSRVNFATGKDVCEFVKSEFNVIVPEKFDSEDAIRGLIYSYVNETMEERILRAVKKPEVLTQIENIGQMTSDFCVAVSRERVRNFGGIITARNGRRFAACHSSEFNQEMHEELANSFPEVDGTLLITRSFHFDVTIYELASKKINALEQLANVGGTGTSELARTEIYGNHMFPPF